ncbi:MAG: hypothetical protein H0W78_10040 [Planctomycetes bacterium]|nr:hypothetical protein [Planctomycetota bacterium]
MKPGFLTYLGAAFNARPLGMPLPPNWVGLAAAGLLGLVNPGFWLIGAGLELGYLLALTSSARFRATVDAAHLQAASGTWESKRAALIERLPADERKRQEALEERCRAVLTHGQDGDEATLDGAQAESLAQLAWVHLRLLLSRNRLDRVVSEAEPPAEVAKRIRDLQKRIADPSTSEGLKNSLASQLEILNSRQASHTSVRDQLALIDAELERLRQQVELVREQTALSADASGASRTIDALGATLGETTRWLSDQRQVLGEVEDLTTAPPPAALFAATSKKPTQRG